MKKSKNIFNSNLFLEEISNLSITDTLNSLDTHINGLTSDDASKFQDVYGNNKLSKDKKPSFIKRFIEAFINPFTIILFVLAIISFITDVILETGNNKDYMTVGIISLMILTSGIMRFIQETKSSNASEKLKDMVETTTGVMRDNTLVEIPLDEVVRGDIVVLSAGDIIPADIKLLETKDLFIKQTSLTGESYPVEKIASSSEKFNSVLEDKRLAFMGTSVVSGYAKGVVVVTGDHTYLGKINKKMNEKPQPTNFDKGISSISWLLIRFMLFMVPVVFVINGLTKGDYAEAFLFAVSIAVGLTPEMLPMIVTTSLSKGAVELSKKKIIVKNLNSIQNFGSMDILFTDKTGTLTQDLVIIEDHLDLHGNTDVRVLRHAYLNSFFQTGLKNLMDRSIIEKTNELKESHLSLQNLNTEFTKIDEIPFDFSRRRMSVIIKNSVNKKQMVTKGAIEEILSICTHAEIDGTVVPLTKEKESFILDKANSYNKKGYRVIGVAQKTSENFPLELSIKDESDMVLIGFLTFYDPPKESAQKAISSLNDYGVSVKVLTGDNEIVTKSIAEKIGIPNKHILLGQEIDLLDDENLYKEAKDTYIFAKLSPEQKSRIVTVFMNHQHVVGFMGDGINDAPAMKTADIGISVDSGSDIAKESADIILLEKDLEILKNGMIEGRKTYANMMKYIKMTTSSNFGNMFSVLIASAFLPFLPMLAIHLLFLNLIYDIACIALPFDNVDEDYLKKPKNWDTKSVRNFMFFFGPISSVFDILTFIFMFFVIGPILFGTSYFNLNDTLKLEFASTFQTGWFVLSMWTQTLIIFIIRTNKRLFKGSLASKSLYLLTLLGIVIVTSIPFTVIGTHLDLVSLPWYFFILLFSIVIIYLSTVSFMKHLFIKKYGDLL
ncbi:Magnesium-translocating P-type ATPase [Alteracholeplasma palmae J233]|uniref:Magnesium-transporting ATPase, P-type 1 n=1 Tax=Alteracholeplasma palmae (strain ATCC 49389 / J233) TaxID=1318466 RepID=U4KR30_ALTPJ|nr:magnesium-translocating P-type ATPase [Alteracholeplasma palmae]CCV63816.1 Magnesium-translocating P-type ATPase [Alteracholeplasma palmae J233]